MPNHVTNRISGSESAIRLLLGTDGDGEEIVDFRKIIPQPECLVVDDTGSHLITAAKIALGLVDVRNPPQHNPRAMFDAGEYGKAADVIGWQCDVRQLTEGPFVKDFSQEEFERFVAVMRSYRGCGQFTWYEWNREYWGTKWNAYSYKRVSDGEITFQTAWSAPHPVMQKLNELCPHGFRHEWADEDTGNNVGWINYLGEDEPEGEELSGTREGYELCFKLRPEDREYYRLVDGKYEYDEAAEVA